MKAKIIAIANHKGGVGKTASVASIGAIFAARGKKVLLVDLDTQANLTRHFMDTIPPRIIYHAIREQAGLPIYPIRANLDIVPSGLDMAGIDLELQMMFNRERVLKTLLDPYCSIYDYIILDCPPALGLITINALTSSTHLIVPMKADLMSNYGLSMMDQFCVKMQVLNPGIHIDYIFFNMYEKGQTMTDAIETDVRTKYGDRVLATTIRKNNDVAKAAFEFTDVVSFNPEANGAKDFQALVTELEIKL
jgi:chromosome partitioning protein